MRPLLACLSVLLVTGPATADPEVAAEINDGLVNALDTVGANLLGDAVFGAFTVPDGNGDEAVAIKLVAEPGALPTRVTVIHPPDPVLPPDPCRAGFQLRTQGDAAPTLLVDPLVFDDLGLVPADLSGYPPNPCVDPPVFEGLTEVEATAAERVAEALIPGLVEATDSVGGSLLGRSVFAAFELEDDGSLALNLVAEPGALATWVTLIYPPDPVEPVCRAGFQLRLDGAGRPTLLYDPAVLPGLMVFLGKELPFYPPDPCVDPAVVE